MRASRLERLARLAKRDADRAAAAMSAARLALAAQVSRGEALQVYRSELLEQFDCASPTSPTSPKSIDGASLRASRGFLRQLDAGISVLQGQIAEARTRLRALRSTWRDREQRARALTMLHERSERERRRERLRRQQRRDDAVPLPRPTASWSAFARRPDEPPDRELPR